MDDDRMHTGKWSLARRNFISSHSKVIVPTGYCGLAASVAALGLSTSEPVEIDLAVGTHVLAITSTARTNAGSQCASLGSLNRDFVGAIYQACQGGHRLTPARLATRSTHMRE